MEPKSCLVCRKRKVKCDRNPGSCRKCDKFGAQCAYAAATAAEEEPNNSNNKTRSAASSSSSYSSSSHYSSSPASRRPGGSGGNQAITKAGLARRRTSRSCIECQRTKAKCSGEAPCCGRCGTRGLPCRYRDAAGSGGGGDNGAYHEAPRASPSRALVDAPWMPPPWLLSRSLPSVHRVRRLLDVYFSLVHTVRCLGFLHIPTFMERFREDNDEEEEGVAYQQDSSGLVHVMCALAAPFYCAHITASSSSSSSSADEDDGSLPPGTRFHEAGRGWAASAMEHLLANFGSAAVECLMAAVLLHEHHLRVGEHAKALLVSGIVARHVQILQLNVEHDDDVLCERRRRQEGPGAAAAGSAGSAAAGAAGAAMSMNWAVVKESRRRLFWACYLQDAFIECGIDQLRFISADDAQVQLPCREDDFIRGTPRVTEMLRRGTVLPFVVDERRDNDGDDVRDLRRCHHHHEGGSSGSSGAANLDLRAFYIRAMWTRSRVLKYVKHLDGDVPWSAKHDSRFQQLDAELADTEASIPDALRMTPANVYLYKASGRLNVFFGLHIVLAQTFNDLYRVGVSGLVFPPSATTWIRDNAPPDFLARCHRVCAAKAAHIAGLLDDLYRCHRESMVDVPFAMHAQVCSGVLVTTLASWMMMGRRRLDDIAQPLLPGRRVFDDDYARMLESNVRVLRHLRRYMKVDLFVESATQALKRFEKLREKHQQQHQQRSRNEGGAGPGDEDGEQPAHDGETVQHPRQFSLDYILNPLGVYPIARTQASERHKPEEFASAAPAPAPAPVARPLTPSSATDPRGQQSAEELMVLDDAFRGSAGTWDWSQVPFLENMGYPMFLENDGLEHGALLYNGGAAGMMQL
ncbi:hypothetical protein JDV02_010741 [Purpureocillium takamizusanense]|uniref:Zn(2)-C6 fungal-type domain-containing protein n=1 Tax=Purpureocillium takamizusanense TaxID=2060973 RepID=A0A9Q8QTA7_9HYPO|nr:uncharacterized protein JDV02_010741 [Purpureocillium takamizusanense]UNI25032.1 hypothetical protein JDV02_010741 [Purpureocillium takamizusanense]